ncbi:5-formyltetrahydrofolate cyclo-ligase [Breoghania sp. L-A4]|uniref:5-formyltetrahydrofolate cyclo-ligase n=1 Tax=Breoghania sp. L-A4 TaxID=2304600 RepID=UPI000E35FCBA|nr:5-formyltetrahydrofolate cyclo-ligase [Breoghania sp. L-A4]AXS41807.1 5-formyltetrahydrofolate cyclo-ligase [Breoghania sp. L-A4]
MTDAAVIASKDALRREALGRRGALGPQVRIEGSLALMDHLDSLDLPQGAIVSGFWPIFDEIDPRPLMHAIGQRGHRLCLPVVRQPHMIFRELSPETELVPAGFGTSEPSEASEELQPDVLLVPLAAFDRRGNRIGYGKGHYDKAIAKLEEAGPRVLIGIAFSVQEVQAVPDEPHDKPLGRVLTEAGLITCSGQKDLSASTDTN